MTQARPHRLAGGLAVAWGTVLLGWALYNCFGQVGFATFVKGIFFYGGSSVGAETGSLNYAALYLTAGILLLRGRDWARGVAVGVALVEGYNRVRSLTGALLDPPQRHWFTGTTEGWLKLATFGAGVLVTTTLVVLLVAALRRGAGTGWAPAPAPWAAGGPSPFQPLPEQLHWSLRQTLPQDQALGQPVPQQQLFGPPQQAAPGAAAQPQTQPQTQPQARPQTQPQAPVPTRPDWPQPAHPAAQQPPQPAWPAQQPPARPPVPPQAAPPQQAWPAPPVAPGPVTPGPVAPGPVPPPPYQG
ncbi:hypothetical protein OH807_25585 [Kitasatospora sp. NBC_01560]|uniref:hypothetical protein n=1 Tax=Kitasatospora sp. NBC_01560 TaxID=2975965 RepID=UPI003865CA77